MRARSFNWPRVGRVTLVLAAGILLLAVVVRLSWAGKQEYLSAPPPAAPEAVSRCPLLATYAETVSACRDLGAADRARSLQTPTPSRRP